MMYVHYVHGQSANHGLEGRNDDNERRCEFDETDEGTGVSI